MILSPQTVRIALLFVFCGLSSGGLATTPPAREDVDAAARARVVADYGKLPMSFEANGGQADPAVKFLARGQGYGLFLTATEAVLSLRAGALDAASAQPNAVIRMRLSGANPHPQLSGVDSLPGVSNYFIGDDPAQWHSAIPNFAKVRYAEVYPGIDLVYYGKQRQLEYDFVVAPGADPRRIVFDFKGVTKPALDREGNLVLVTASGNVVQHKPLVYQDIDGARRTIDSRYVLHGKRRVGFQIARYDATRPLVIDPTLDFATYLGGNSSEDSGGIAVDGSGNAYMTGYTKGGTPGFPTTLGAYQTAYGGGPNDAFVTKLNATGSALVYSTYLGGSGNDYGHGIAVDASGNAYVTGYTEGSFPTTPGAYQTVYGGGSFDAFVTKLNATGSALVYSTYLGGSTQDTALGIAVDGSGNAFVTGYTSGSFPTTPGAFQTTVAPGSLYAAFVTKLNAVGSALVYSTYLGGGHDRGTGIVVDGGGNAYVTGTTDVGGIPTTPGAYQTIFGGGTGVVPTDAFVTKLNAAGSALVYSTFLGGAGNEYGYGIAVDASGNAYVTGSTEAGFPTTPGSYQTTFGGSLSDAFVTKLNATGSALVYSTYLGGSGADTGYAIAVDRTGYAYVTGWTNGAFPTTPGAYQTIFGGGNNDVFMTRLNTTGSALDYSTYLGGSGGDFGGGIAVDGSGYIYLTGETSGAFPTTAGAYQTAFGGGGSDVFVARFALPAPSPTLVSASSRRTHGASGTFDLALSPVPTNPTTEPRTGPAQSIVFTFDKAVTAGAASTSEGVATVGTPTFSGNEMTIPLSGVINSQYVTVDVSGVVAADGGTGGTGSVRLGFLFGDVNQSRQVLVSDVGLVNAAILFPLNQSNFIYDVNVDGKVLVSDAGLVNANLLKKLPAP